MSATQTLSFPSAMAVDIDNRVVLAAAREFFERSPDGDGALAVQFYAALLTHMLLCVGTLFDEHTARMMCEAALRQLPVALAETQAAGAH